MHCEHKYQGLVHDLPKTAMAKEVSIGRLSADGAAVEYEFVRVLPFDVEMASKISWECTKADFNCLNTDIEEICADDMRAIKQDFLILECDMTVKFLAVCKQFTDGDRTVVIWEGLCQWLSLSGGMATTTHEQGSIAIDSSSESSDVSIAKGFLRLTPISSCSNWLRLVQNTSTLTNIELPTFQNVINGRHQYVENSLLDASRRVPHLFSSPVTV